MRLLVDMIGAQSASRYRGIGHYTRGFVKGLIATSGEHEVYLAVCTNLAESAEAVRTEFGKLVSEERILNYHVLDGTSFVSPDNTWRRRASELVRDTAFASCEPDVILASSIFEGYAEDAVTSEAAACRPAVRAVLSYDLIPLRQPDQYLTDAGVNAWYQEKLGLFSSFDLFLAISQAAADDIRKYIDPKGSIVSVMAAADEFLDAGDKEKPQGEVLRQLTISRPYFIYTATYEPRKNFERLVEAFATFTRTSPVSFQLVLVTSNHCAQRSQIERETRRVGLMADDVVITGHVDHTTLELLYRDARAMVYPSLMEGFGLPILEAMHCGTAVVCSNTSSMPEIVGLEEAMFDPTSVQAIANIMKRLAEDESFRSRLITNGIHRRSLFSWITTGAKAWSAFEESAARNQFARPRRHMRWTRYRTLVNEIAAIDLPSGTTEFSNRDLRCLANSIGTNEAGCTRISSRVPLGADFIWRLEGPFDSSYSLALVNRETARALRRQGVDVELVSTEGPGDYLPNLAYLEREHPDILALYRAPLAQHADRPVAIGRNLYPPRVEDMKGDWNTLHQYAWEESRIPSEWVDKFNLHLDGITCLSTHVLKILQDSGVAVPMAVSGGGVDHWEHVEAATSQDWPGKGFRFLHVSSCFPRKGVDVLLAAYGRAFRHADDVTLIIKTFPNPHNSVAQDLERLCRDNPNYPDVVLLTDDLSEAQLKSLYLHCHVFVAPSRAEGFGLPLAEAILAGLPVITTAWGGQTDFCKPGWSWLIDYSFARANTHFAQSGSVWAEPDVDDLVLKLRVAGGTSASERAAITDRARQFLLAQFSWDAVVTRMRFANAGWARDRPRPTAQIGWVTTWNCRCGIASYSEFLVGEMPNKVTIFAAKDDNIFNPNESNIRRHWQKYAPDEDLRELETALLSANIDAVVIQFNYGFFNFNAFIRLVKQLKDNDIHVFIVLHATIDPPGQDERRLIHLRDTLHQCDRVLVHSIHDLNRLKAIGVDTNTCLIGHGVVAGMPTCFTPHAPETFIIGSYGFCLPHKGLKSLVQAFELMATMDSGVQLELVNAEYPGDVSSRLADELESEIIRAGLSDRARLTRDFLTDEEALTRLRACDLLVFAYEETGESSSAAVRFGIASGRAVVTTCQPIFDDVKPAVFQTDASEPVALAFDLLRLMTQLREHHRDVMTRQAEAERWRTDHGYDRMAARLSGLIQSISTTGHGSEFYGR
ncbi:glycosyltransferase [Acidiphilium acidophilum]|uniref:glycosyltransferase n=1 Tax=Acidiphilium acidophilum TaxID=76588 RepID=UPI002E8E7567|nr:glycosyltransferase [Acidiphilium acidophilum]